MSGVVNSGQFGYLLDPLLRKVFTETLQKVPSMRTKLYTMNTSTKATEYDYGVGGLGDMEEFTGTIPYSDFSGQYRTSYTHKEWVKGIKIERKLLDDDQYNVIEQRPKQLALSASRSMEKHAASLFNNAFNTSLFAGGDTYALCASAHSYVGTSTTISNSGTSALSSTSVAATRLLMRKFTDETDNLIDAQGGVLIVPMDLEETAWEIVNTPGKIGTADNDLNFNKSRYEVMVWPYLNDTNNWFMVDKALMGMYLNWFTRIGTEFNKDKDFDTYVSKWSTYTRYSFGFSGWQWIYGHAVS